MKKPPIQTTNRGAPIVERRRPIEPIAAPPEPETETEPALGRFHSDGRELVFPQQVRKDRAR